jgi:ABC-type glycerol-3-phosphate transport system substrate-binding protein
MPPDDSNKSVLGSIAVAQDPLSSAPKAPPAGDLTSFTTGVQGSNTGSQNVNPWGVPSVNTFPPQEQPVQATVTPQNQNVWGSPVVPQEQTLPETVVQNDPNKNIWGQPINIPATPSSYSEPVPVETFAPVQQAAPLVVTEPVMVQTPAQPAAEIPVPEIASQPQVTPTFNPYDTPPATIGVTPSGGGNPSFESAPLAGNPNPILETDLPPEPKRGFPKVIIVAVVLIIAVLGIIFAIKAFMAARATKVQTASKQTEIIWWGLWEEERVIKPLIEEYQAKNPKVKITYVRNSEQDYRERLANALAKGTGPDIFRFHNTWVPMFSKELDAVPATVMSTTDYTKNYFPVISLDASRGTGFVGIPLGYDALTLFINEDIFSQEGLEPPKTWVELRDIAKVGRLTKVENGQIVRSGVALGRTENVDHWQEIIGLMLVQNRVNLKKPEGKKAEDALKFFSVFSAVDKVWDETLPPSTRAFATGKVAMYFGPSWRALTIKELNPNLKFKTVPLPQLPKEDPNEVDVSYATYWMDGVWTRGKNKDLAWDFMKFLSTKESMEKMYQLAANSRGFGTAYPRLDMKDMLTSSTILGSVVTLAPTAKSWYLASRTFDGPTGINSQLSKYFEDAINAINSGVNPTKAMETLTPGVVQVLQQYGLTK